MQADFCVFILTHGRPDNVYTTDVLAKRGYTGKIFYILDDEDSTIERYRHRFGAENIFVFNKKEMADQVDEGNNFDNRAAPNHARNASFKIAKEIGFEFFILLEDDYVEFEYKVLGMPGIAYPKNLDFIFKAMMDFYKSINAASIALAQNGDFIGGIDNGKQAYRFSKRKCMNTFFCSTRRPIQFIGQFNDDVNTYTTLGNRGNLFFTIPVISIRQVATQKTKGGMTEAYLRHGTYCKSFTSVMMHPSGVHVKMMNSSNKRIHHGIDWNATAPLILSERHKKL
jgi:hypothetical protein